MAKKQNEKDAYYFSHDSNAHRDEKMMRMKLKYRHEGSGIFWEVVELLSEAKNYQLSHAAVEALADSLRIEPDKLREWLNDCINTYHLFESDGENYWSNSLRRRMEKKEKIRKEKSEAGKKGAAAKKDKKQPPLNSSASSADSVYSKGKETKANEMQRKEKTQESIKTEMQGKEHGVEEEELPF